MARILLTVWPFAGHYHPAIAIAQALKKRKHEVAFYTGGSAQKVIEGEGFQCFPFRHVDENKVISIVSTEFTYTSSFREGLKRASRQKAKFREWLIRTIPQQVSDLEEIISNWTPDVLLCDFGLWGPILVLSETRKLPVAVLSVAAACVLPGREMPFWGPGLPRPRNGWMRLRSQTMATVARWLSTELQSEVNQVRNSYGLKPLDCSVVEFTARMPLYIVPSPREFDYSRQDLPKSVHHVGPCLWDKPDLTPAPAWLGELPPGKPLIYITEATVGTREPVLLRTALRACENMAVQVVMTTGKQRAFKDVNLGVVPPHIRVESYVPQSDLLAKTSVMVTVGGSGGVLAALKAGVPLVVVPTEWDRPENAQRVVESGCGIRIDPKDCDAERLQSAIKRVMNEPSFRDNARRLAKVCTQYGGPASAAHLLEQLGVQHRRLEHQAM